MIYPKKLSKNIIGITALSSGVGFNLDDYISSLNNLKEKGFSLIETDNVRKRKNPSSSAKTRAKEFDELILNKDVEAIICAAGGDFLIEVLPYINLDNIKNKPKWLMGASDPTYLLYLVTTSLDIATLYGHNAGSFDSKKLHKSQEIALEYLKGNYLKQTSYKKYESNRELRVDNNYNLDKEVKWESNKESFKITGRIIGGCIDCLRDLPGTPYDKTKEFVETYKNDGIIFYFDIFSLSSEDFYRSLIMMRESSWFQNIKGVIVGRIIYPSSFTNLTYEKALKKVFKNIPLIWNADIGHVPPKMTIINGSIITISYKNNTASIEFNCI